MKVLRPLRRRWGQSGEGLMEITVRGGEHVQQAVAEDCGILITPNHPSHADAFAMLGASDALKCPFYFMTAWQVFERTHSLGRFILRRHGCFSINREGHDIRAMRQAIAILEHGTSPLVIFPEGEVYHLNDRTMPFRQGAVRFAQLAAARSTRPIVSIPTAIRYTYIDDPTPALESLMAKLERVTGLASDFRKPLVSRIGDLSKVILQRKEQHYLGAVGSGSLAGRTRVLAAQVLAGLEEQFDIRDVTKTVPERVKEVRRRIIERQSLRANKSAQRRLQVAMDDAFFVMQLFSYPVEYLDSNAPIERIAETIDKLEEDLLGVSTTYARGRRRAAVTLGEPLLIRREATGRARARGLTDELSRRVNRLLDNGQPPVMASRVSESWQSAAVENMERVACSPAC